MNRKSEKLRSMSMIKNDVAGENDTDYKNSNPLAKVHPLNTTDSGAHSHLQPEGELKSKNKTGVPHVPYWDVYDGDYSSPEDIHNNSFSPASMMKRNARIWLIVFVVFVILLFLGIYLFA